MRNKTNIAGMIVLCGLTLLNPPFVFAMSCPSSGGYTTTQNSKTYCQSTGAYKNYWSAYTWCDAVGGKLVDLDTECGTWTTGSGGCTKLKFSNYAETDEGYTSSWTWTSTMHAKEQYNYRVALSSGGVYSYYGRENQDTYGVALCVE